MSVPVRIALIGTGRIGQVHASNIFKSPDAVLQWVCDPFVEGARATAERLGGRATAESAEVFAAGDVDAVVIASPTSTHVDLISAAIDAGIPVFCEKPVDLDIVRVDGLREKVAGSGVPVALGFNRRFDRHFAALQRRIVGGEIGRLEQLSITSRDPAPPPADYISVSGGIFRDMTIHDFDMARFFVPDIVAVFAQGSNLFSTAIKDAGDYDTAVVMLRGSSGQLVTITNSRHSAYGYDQRIEAFGANGLLRVENVGETQVTRWSKDAVESRPPYMDFFLQRYADAYSAELTAFIALARGEASSSPTFEDGRAALILADAASRSAEIGEPTVVHIVSRDGA